MAKIRSPAGAAASGHAVDPADNPASELAQPGITAANFERSLAELEALVDRLEQGDLGLEESLVTFERGVRLTRGCQRALEEAEQRVRILTDFSANADSEPFVPAPGRTSVMDSD